MWKLRDSKAGDVHLGATRAGKTQWEGAHRENRKAQSIKPQESVLIGQDCRTEKVTEKVTSEGVLERDGAAGRTGGQLTS